MLYVYIYPWNKILQNTYFRAHDTPIMNILLSCKNKIELLQGIDIIKSYQNASAEQKLVRVYTYSEKYKNCLKYDCKKSHICTKTRPIFKSHTNLHVQLIITATV